MKKIIKENAIILVIVLITLVLFSVGTSPFYGDLVLEDSSIFIVMGKAIKNGMVMYKDIFDHKGPVLFWIETLGQIIYEGKIGIFLLQNLSLFITYKFMYKTIYCLVKNTKKSMLILVLTNIVLALILYPGNFSEEFSLPFISICLYIAVKWIKENQINILSKTYFYSLIFGICFGTVSLIRVNNAATICGVLLAIIIIMIKNKKIKELIISALLFVIGIILIYLPNIIYFISKNALYDMFYGTFIHNFMYMSNDLGTNSNKVIKIIFELLLFSSLLFFIIKTKSKEKDITLIITISTIVTGIVLLIGNGFYHYYIIAIPIISLLMIPFLNTFYNKEVMFIKGIVCALVGISIVIVSFSKILFYKVEYKNTSMEEIKKFIDKNVSELDRDKIIGLNAFTGNLYYYGDFLPAYKYAFLQVYLFDSNEIILRDFKNKLKNGEIKYVCMRKYETLNNNKKHDVEDYIYYNYEEIDSIDLKFFGNLTLYDYPLCIYEYKK